MAKHLNKYPHPSKRKSASKRFGVTVEDLCVKRDEILEHDSSYCANVRTLWRRVASGKLPATAARSIQPSLVMSALRRAGLSLRHSTQLCHA